MGTEWMGRYRPLVAALVKHTNVVQRAAGRTVRLSEEVSLSTQEWQVFEYILEHQDDDSCMNHISERLGMTAKQVDNALYHAKKKLARLIDSLKNQS